MHWGDETWGVASAAVAALLCLGPAPHRIRRQRTPTQPPTLTLTLTLAQRSYLIDAILEVPRTRQMYVRRLRTLMDEFITSGRLQASQRLLPACIRGRLGRGGVGVRAIEWRLWRGRPRLAPASQPNLGSPRPPRSASLSPLLPPLPPSPQALVTAMHTEIREEAKRDAAAWKNPGGRAQLMGGWVRSRQGRHGCGSSAHASACSPPPLTRHPYPAPCPLTALPPPGDPDRGYQQLVSEQLPIRRQQLFELYGPRGQIPLIPGE